MKTAKQNRERHAFVDTVMFFDEANTTEEIGLIKRVMVDNEFNIRNSGLKIVAACNPYRKCAIVAVYHIILFSDITQSLTSHTASVKLCP